VGVVNFADVIWMVNRIGNLSVDEKPVSQERRKWEIYNAKVLAGNLEIPITILYLQKSATINSLPAAIRKIREHDNVQVIVSEEIKIKRESIARELEFYVDQITGTRDYLSALLETHTTRYSKGLKNFPLAHYVAPSVSCSKIQSNSERDLVRSWLSQDKSQEGRLGVLLAEAGHGKTFSTRCIACQLLKDKKHFPIYVCSDQWQSLSASEMGDISKVIAHSFSSFNSSLTWFQGAEEEFLSLMLKVGFFRIIFDGLDEYIYHTRGSVTPIEVLSKLRSLAEDTGSPVLISARTSFWNAEIESQYDADQIGEILHFNMLPFTQNMAHEFFSLRLDGDQDRANKALTLIDKLNARYSDDNGYNFIGRGFFLSLVCEFIDRGGNGSLDEFNKSTSLHWLFLALCVRECERQEHLLTPENQLSVFRELCEFMENGYAEHEYLDYAIDVVDNTFTSEQREHTMRLMVAHPLVQLESVNDGDEGKWTFAHERIHMAFLADFILEKLLDEDQFESESSKNMEVHRRISQSLGSEEYCTGVVEAIFERLLELHGYDALSDEVSKMVVRLFQLADQFGDDSQRFDAPERYIATTLGLRCLDAVSVSNENNKERTTRFLSILGKDEFKGLYFIGPVSRLDFKSATISKCRLEGVTFVRCSFDHSTHIHYCVIENTSAYRSIDFEHCVFHESNKIDLSSETTMLKGRLAVGINQYGESEIDADFNRVLQVLRKHKSSGFRLISDHSILRPLVAPKHFHASMVEVISKYLLVAQVQENGELGTAYTVKKEIDLPLITYSDSGLITGILNNCLHSIKQSIDAQSTALI